MKINYYNKDILETTIYVDVKEKKITIENHTNDIIHLAFGVNENPTWSDFENFLESRCPSPQRQNIKEILKSLDIPYYNTLLICEKTEGRIEEDNSWMDIDDIEV